MRGSTSARRLVSAPSALRSTGPRPATSVPTPSSSRDLSNSGTRAEASAEAGPSTPRATATPKFSQRPDETLEQAWRRNLDEAREWRRRRSAQTTQLPIFLPGHETKPRSPAQASLSTLLASGAALGHATSMLNPTFTPYVYGNRSGLSIIDLDQTLPILRRTAGLVRDVVKDDGVVLFVGTREGHKRIVEKAAERLEDNGFCVSEWIAGVLTNSETFFGTKPLKSGAYRPDLVVFLNPSDNLGAIKECTARNIPTVGVVDTDTDPRIVTYPIPANMESVRTAELIAATLSIAGQEGRRLRLKLQEKRRANPPPRRSSPRQQQQ